MDNLLFSLNAILPVFLVVLAGIPLRRKGIINDNFISVSAKFVFKLALPAFIFRSIFRTDFKAIFNPRLLLYVFLSTLALCAVTHFLTLIFIKSPGTRGAFTQGVFRSNYALIGMPLIFNLFGQEAFDKSVIGVAIVMPLYNILAVIILSVNSESKTNTKKIIRDILTNPIIWGVLIGLVFSLFKIGLPKAVYKALDYLSDTAIPLALLNIGGQLSFTSLKSNLKHGIAATILKIAVAPFLFTLLAYFLGFRGDELGIILIVFGAPTAVSSYIMARGMNCNPGLAGEIVLLTTMGSAFTIFIGVTVLQFMALI